MTPPPLHIAKAPGTFRIVPGAFPLSLTSFASSPRGGAIGMSVSFRLDERSLI